MKNIKKIIFLASILILISCKGGQKKDDSAAASENSNQQSSKVEVVKTAFSSSVDTIVDEYLKTKNALVNGDSQEAVLAAKALLKTINNVDSTEIDSELQSKYKNIAESAKSDSEAISDNADNLEVQRTHFAKLSSNINQLIMLFGTNKKLYWDYCPMFDDGNSGYWISESEGIRNPYYGEEMLTCGMIKNEY